MIGLEYVLKLFEMTQQDLADKLEIKRQNIDSWIRGKRNIPKKYLPTLANTFNIPEEYFQKELNYQDKEKIQMMKLHGTNNLEELGYKVYDEEYEPDELALENLDNSKKEKMQIYNQRRSDVIDKIQAKLNLGIEGQSYSADIYMHVLNRNEVILSLIEKFENIISDIDGIIQEKVIDELLTSFELYQGKTLPEKYNPKNDFIEEYVNITTIVDKECIKFIEKVLHDIQNEGTRVLERREKFSKMMDENMEESNKEK